MKLRVFAIAALLCAMPAWAQMVEVPEERVEAEKTPATGKERATEYFKERKSTPAKSTSPDATPRFLMVHLGTFVSDQSFQWGDVDEKNVGRFNFGVTYRMGEWVNSMDWALRMEYTTYKVPDGFGEEDAGKISFSGIITFPDANSRFPLYFGGGLGAGFFVQQLDGKSPIALDYTLLLGARFFDVFDDTGLMIETGLKNHLMFAGQFNGVFINAGCVFAF